MQTKYHHTHEQELINLTRQGDQWAFREIMQRTEKLVSHIINGMVLDKEDREDLAQDIYIKAFHHIGSFRQEAKLSTWIGRIAYNTCLNHLQKKKLPLQHKFWNSMEEEPVADSNPMEILSQKQVSGILQEAIDNLSPPYKTLITLFHFSSFSLNEISLITEMPQGTVKNYLFRARKELQNQILAIYKKKEAL